MDHPRVFQISEKVIDDGLLREAAGIVSSGGVIVFPTETVYGIGCLISEEKAVARIYDIKGRNEEKPLAVYLPDSESIRGQVAGVSLAAEKLMSSFLPGPITLILNNKKGVSTGYRVPDNEIITGLLRLLPAPLVGTSANRSGEKECTTADEVLTALGSSMDVVIDSGPCMSSVPSTVIDCTGGDIVILREGAVSEGRIRDVLG